MAALKNIEPRLLKAMLISICISTTYALITRQLLKRSLALSHVISFNKNLDKGATIEKKDLSLHPVLKNNIPQSALSNHQIDTVVGRQTNHAIQAGDILRVSDLHNPDENYLNKIQAGYRIISVPGHAENAVGGILQPGDHVDLWAQLPTHPKPRKILDNAIIWWWHIDGTVTEDNHYSNYVLLPVPNAQVQEVLQAIAQGQIWLTLRANTDANTQHIQIFQDQGQDYEL